jgi:hypothetical protein
LYAKGCCTDGKTKRRHFVEEDYAKNLAEGWRDKRRAETERRKIVKPHSTPFGTSKRKRRKVGEKESGKEM